MRGGSVVSAHTALSEDPSSELPGALAPGDPPGLFQPQAPAHTTYILTHTQLPGFFRPQAPAHTAYIHIYTLNFFLYWRKELNLFWLNGSRRMRVRYDK